MKRLLALVLCFVLCFTITDSIFAISDYSELSSMTDEEFFGVWDSENGKWTSESGLLNYEETPGLSAVFDYVKEGNYANAKSEFLSYCRTRETNFDTHNTSYSYDIAELMADGIMWNSAVSLAGTATIEGNELKPYRIDVSSLIKKRGTYSIVIMQRYKGEEAAEICTRESEYKPTLDVYVDGHKTTFNAAKDAYTWAENPNTSYGTEEYMYCKESVDPDVLNPYRNVFGPDSKRAFIQFNVRGFEKEEIIEAAYINIYARSLGEATSIILWENQSSLWTENSLAWENASQFIMNFNDSEYDFSNLPAEENGFIFSLASGVARFQWATTLSGCYVTSRDERYAQTLIKFLCEFIYSTRDDVGYDGHQSTAMRLNLFANIINDLLYSEHLTPEIFTAMVKNVWQQAKFLTYPANYRPDHNHGVFHVRGLMKAVILFPEFRQYDEWKEMVVERWNELASNLMASDDYREGTTGYAITVLNVFNNAILTTEQFDIELGENFREKTRKLAKYIATICFPDGYNIQLGDSDLTGGFSAVKQSAEILDDDALLYQSTNGTSGEYPGYDSIYLAGRNRLAVMRTGWEKNDLMLAINAASADGRSHTHLDNMSLVLYAYGQRMIVDTGKRNYADEPVSNWLRLTTEAHNTITIDGRNQGMASGSVNLFATNKYFDTYQGYDATVTPFKHTRKIMFVKPYFWIVSDNVTGSDDDNMHTYDQNWHFESAANIALDGNVMTTNFDEGANLKIIDVDNPNSHGLLRDGYYSASQIDTTEAKYLTYRQNKDGDVYYDTVLFPIAEGSMDNCEAERIALDGEYTDASAYLLNLSLGGREYQSIVYNSNEDETSYRKIGDVYGFDGRQLYLEKTKAGKLSSICMSEAETLDYNGVPIVALRGDSAIDDLSIIYADEEIKLYSESMTSQLLQKLSVSTEGRDIKRVTLNDNPISFYKNGDAIVFTESYNRVELSGNSAVLDTQRTTNSLFVFEDNSYNAVMSFQSGTTLTLSDWDGELPSVLVCSSDVSVDNAQTLLQLGYSRNVVFDKSVTLTIPAANYKMKYLRNGTLYELETDKYITVEKTADTVSVTFPSKLYDIVLYTEKQQGSSIGGIIQTPGANTDSGSGGTGGSSGGGGSSNSNDKEEKPDKNENAYPEITLCFDDIDGHWAKETILNMVKNGIVNGYGNTFKPENNVTRAEFTAMLTRLMNISGDGGNSMFDDVKNGAWYKEAVSAAYKAQLITGSNGCFYPDTAITREEACVILSRTADYLKLDLEKKGELEAFADAASVSEWARDAVSRLFSSGIVRGIDEKTIAPKENVTRAMAVTLLERIMKLIN